MSFALYTASERASRTLGARQSARAALRSRGVGVLRCGVSRKACGCETSCRMCERPWHDPAYRRADGPTVVMTRPPRERTADVARELAPVVFCLGPAGRTQTNVYFVRSGSSWVLIDAGWPNDASRIEKAAESLFGADSRPAAILLTHRRRSSLSGRYGSRWPRTCWISPPLSCAPKAASWHACRSRSWPTRSGRSGGGGPGAAGLPP
jgi:Metallo-beta-lactamase superfamily